MNNFSIFVVGYNSELHLVEAEDLNAVRKYVLNAVGYTAEKATAREVAGMMAAGSKVVTVKGKE